MLGFTPDDEPNAPPAIVVHHRLRRTVVRSSVDRLVDVRISLHFWLSICGFCKQKQSVCNAGAEQTVLRWQRSLSYLSNTGLSPIIPSFRFETVSRSHFECAFVQMCFVSFNVVVNNIFGKFNNKFCRMVFVFRMDKLWAILFAIEMVLFGNCLGKEVISRKSRQLCDGFELEWSFFSH